AGARGRYGVCVPGRLGPGLAASRRRWISRPLDQFSARQRAEAVRACPVFRQIQRQLPLDEVLAGRKTDPPAAGRGYGPGGVVDAIPGECGQAAAPDFPKISAGPDDVDVFVDAG